MGYNATIFSTETLHLVQFTDLWEDILYSMYYKQVEIILDERNFVWSPSIFRILKLIIVSIQIRQTTILTDLINAQTNVTFVQGPIK